MSSLVLKRGKEPYDGNPDNLYVTGDRAALLELAMACIDAAQFVNAREMHLNKLKVTGMPGLKALMIDCEEGDRCKTCGGSGEVGLPNIGGIYEKCSDCKETP